MATIKVKLKESSLNNGIGYICYQVTHNRKTRQIPTKMHIPVMYWNSSTEQIKSTNSTAIMVKHIVESDMAAFEKIISKLENTSKGYNAIDIVQQFDKLRQTSSLKEFFRQEITHMIQYGKHGTARNYQKAYNSIFTYLHNTDIPLYAIRESFIEGYNAYLQQREIVRNSISFYMRILRAIYNKAARQRLVEQNNPFIAVYTGIDKTRKRAVDEQIIMKLCSLNLSGEHKLEFVRDLFIFSYCTRGMSFVDMAYLKTSNIKGNNIVYIRHKTKQQLQIKIESKVQGIISKYAKSATFPYVLPILTTSDPQKAFTQYQSALSYYNKLLKKISVMLQLETSLTSYTARHSWASVARNYNIPISVISAGMGHTSDKTTQIYLTSLENASIDMANHKIISRLGKNKTVHTANQYRML